MTEASDVLLLGLSDTGKSTFLAALYGCIKSRNTKCKLALDVLDDDREYLEKLSRQWANAEKLDHTIMVGRMNRLNLLDKRVDPPRRLALRIPDMSGEAFGEQFESRQWTLDFEETYAGAERVLLFVHSEKMVEPPTLADLQQARLGLGEASADRPSKTQTETVKKWRINSCRTQVQIVDLLQFLARARPLPRPRRLALIVSAWDRLHGIPDVAPRPWLGMTMGLLAQYVRANPAQYEVEVFGMSAQGFDYEKDDAAERLAELSEPAERVRILRGSSTEERRDITEPIQWLLDPERSND